MAARDREIQRYVERQCATVGRDARQEPQGAVPTSPIGKLRDAAGPCLGVLDEYESDSYSQHAGAVAFSRDGRSVLHARGDGTILRLSLPSGALLWREPMSSVTNNRIYAIAVSPDGSRFIVSPSNGSIRMHDMETGQILWEASGNKVVLPWVLSFSPDGDEILGSGRSQDVAIYSSRDGMVLTSVRSMDATMVAGSAWAPKGDFFATADNNCWVRVWDSKTHRLLHQRRNHRRDINGLSISPDGKRVATAGEDSKVVIWSPFEKDAQPLVLEGHRDFLWSVAFSPEGKRVASGGNDRTIRIWDTDTGAELAVFEHPEPFAFRLAWSPDGALLASAHPLKVRLWDTRETRAYVAPVARQLSAGPLAPEFAILPAALISLLRIGRSAPLSLLRDLLALTGGKRANGTLPGVLPRPAQLEAMVAMRWPVEARIAMVLYLLRDYEDQSFAPPDEKSAAELRYELLNGLVGVPIPEEKTPDPYAYLFHVILHIDERFLALLASLGPEACAEDPTLPMTLLARLDEISPQIIADRKLLDLRVPTTNLGTADAKIPWLPPSGFASSGSITTLLPSQWALPENVRHYRALTGGLLYRARLGREPPRLRPLVLVLDVSPACFGPVEAMLRSAAHALASTLIEAGIPAYLIAAGGENECHALARRADLFEILAARSRHPIEVGKTIQLAQTLLSTLPDSGPFPAAIVVLSHPAFAAEAEDEIVENALVGFFVHYPDHPANPSCQKRLRRCVSLGPFDHSRLPEALAEVLA